MSTAVVGARPRAVHAVIFDLDGTLIKSEEIYEVADGEFLRRHGVEPTPEFFDEVRGMGNGPIFDILRDRYGIEGDNAELLAEKDQIYMELASDSVDFYAPMLDLVERMREGQRPLAIATGSSPAVLRRVLGQTDLASRFNLILSAEDVGRGKPYPDVFLETARRLGVPPKHCLVVEDSVSGVEAALRAKMMCIGVPSTAERPLPDVFYSCDLLFPGGADHVSADAVLEWLDGELS